MKYTLLCEQCAARRAETRVAVFEYNDLSWPMDLSIFKSPYPDLLPDPFPAGVESWEWARCLSCRSRPFLNFIPQGGGQVMLVDGTRAPAWQAGRVLTAEVGYVPIPGYPGAPRVIKDNEGNIGQVVESIGGVLPDSPDPGGPQGAGGATGESSPGAFPLSSDSDGPVQCPVCGKDYTTQARLDKFHNCKGVNDG